MGGIETKSSIGGITKKGPETPQKLSPKKESISRGATSNNAIEKKNTLQKDIYIDAVKNIFTKKEYLLSDAWIAKIASSYRKFDTKVAQDFLKKVPQLLNTKYPKTLFATALIQYANTVQGNTLRIDDYARHVETLQQEHTKLKNLYDAFSTSNDPAFASFQIFKKTYKTPGQTIDQVAQGKSFTNDTYLFFQYLSSSSFQKNKQSVISGMSASHRQEFASYLQSNVRIAQITKVDIKTLQQDVSTTEKREQIADTDPKHFNAINETFTKDFAREDGPKQIVEDVPATVFGAEWLQNTDIQSLFENMQHTFSLSQRESFYKRYIGYFPKGLSQQKVMNVFLSKKVTPKITQVVKDVFARIVVKELQPNTKTTIQKHIMTLYFEQVSSVLKAGGEVVSIEEEGIQYNKNGSIEMKYTTSHGIRGNIFIDENGRVSVTDMFGYNEGGEHTMSEHIVQKIQQQFLDNGSLPSMKKMMERASLQKSLMLTQWQGYFGNTTQTPIDTDVLTPYIITEQDEQSRSALAGDMGRSLSMTQTIDALHSGIQYTRRLTQLPQQDIFSKYIQGSQQFIDTKLYPEYTALQPLRETLRQSPLRVIERWNSAFTTLMQLYERNPHTTKDNFPFALDDQANKETLFQFLSRFCITDTQFDVQTFENMVHAVAMENPLPVSIGEFYADHPILFPSKSLFTMRYPEVSFGDKQQEKDIVVNQSINKLDDLRLDVDLMKKLS